MHNQFIQCFGCSEMIWKDGDVRQLKKTHFICRKCEIENSYKDRWEEMWKFRRILEKYHEGLYA